MSDQIIAAVAKGAALLDEKRRGWWEFTDLDRLRMSSEQDCVLGQEYGDYTTAWERLADLSDRDWAERHGFETYFKDEFPALTVAWRELIEARRSAS